jgi:hypothetical protein
MKLYCDCCEQYQPYELFVEEPPAQGVGGDLVCAICGWVITSCQAEACETTGEYLLVNKAMLVPPPPPPAQRRIEAH